MFCVSSGQWLSFNNVLAIILLEIIETNIYLIKKYRVVLQWWWLRAYQGCFQISHLSFKEGSRARLNTNMSSSQYRDSPYKYMTVLRQPYLYNGNPHAWQDSLYIVVVVTAAQGNVALFCWSVECLANFRAIRKRCNLISRGETKYFVVPYCIDAISNLSNNSIQNWQDLEWYVPLLDNWRPLHRTIHHSPPAVSAFTAFLLPTRARSSP